jgi:hypothetical protein
MKALGLLALFLFSSAFAKIPLEQIECFTDMSDGVCALSENKESYQGRCRIDVVLGLKTGERVEVFYEGVSIIRKNEFALFMNSMVKDKVIALAGEELFEMIKPFSTIRTCE